MPLEELEIHLREAMEQSVRAGFSDPVAFDIAARQIGNPKVLKNEFKKSERTFMKKIMIILAGIFVMFIGTRLILPALAAYRDMGHVWNSPHLKYFLFGVAIVTAGVGTTIVGFKKRKA
ncbi:MAG TPA: permease prefix domain 1-containing protein [Verrucomicrobiae bacterium]